MVRQKKWSWDIKTNPNKNFPSALPCWALTLLVQEFALRLGLATIQTQPRTCWRGAVCLGFETAFRLISRKICADLLQITEKMRKFLCTVGNFSINEITVAIYDNLALLSCLVSQRAIPFVSRCSLGKKMLNETYDLHQISGQAGFSADYVPLSHVTSLCFPAITFHSSLFSFCMKFKLLFLTLLIICTASQ